MVSRRSPNHVISAGVPQLHQTDISDVLKDIKRRFKVLNFVVQLLQLNFFFFPHFLPKIILLLRQRTCGVVSLQRPADVTLWKSIGASVCFWSISRHKRRCTADWPGVWAAATLIFIVLWYWTIMRTVGLDRTPMLGILELFIRSVKLRSHLTPSGDMENKSQFMNQSYPD